jgi:hypothetical protein
MGMESNFNDLKTETMTTEQKEKLMLADDLTAYINEKHTQEECIGFIDGYNAALTKLKLFSIPDVVSMSKCCNVDCKDMTEIDSVYCEFHGSM